MTVHGAAREWIIRMVDGSELRASSDQRDWVALEAAEIKGAITAFRYLAYNAAARAGLYKLSWERFNDEVVEVEQVVDALDVDGEDEQGRGEQGGQSSGRAEATAGS